MLLLPGFPVWAFIDLMFGCLLRLLRWGVLCEVC